MCSIQTRHSLLCIAFLVFLLTPSAGAGRTGVYIALDIAMNEIENTGTVNVYKIVKKLQDSRCNMIQNGVNGKPIYRPLYAVLVGYSVQMATM